MPYISHIISPNKEVPQPLFNCLFSSYEASNVKLHYVSVQLTNEF